ncbi:MAG TPA: AAA family ATPase [Firmicutes bacterium]|nr:AAA family ATPase [Bacillota bacterium]
MTYESITHEMIQALSDEIEAIKEGGGGRQVPLQNGRKVGFAGGRFLYIFNLAFELAVPDDTPAQLKVGNHSYRVTVVSVDGFEVTLALQEDLGTRVPTASLNTSPWYLLEILRTRLQETVAGKLAVNQEMSLRLFNRLPNEVICIAPQPDFTVAQSSAGSPLPQLNEEQEAAVTKALSERITFVWGPPGTGKTTTINYLVPSLVRCQERVLITAHTNTAVDTVLKAAIKGLTKEEVRDGAIIRIGQVSEEDGTIEYITLEAVVERRGAVLKRQLKDIQTRMATVKENHAWWAAWETDLAKVRELETAKNLAEKQLREIIQEKQNMERRVVGLREDETRLQESLIEAQNAGFLRRILGGLNPARIQRQLTDVQAERARCEHTLERITGQLPASQSAAKAAATALAQTLNALSRKGPLPTLDQVHQELKRLGAELEALENQARAIEDELQQLAHRIVREAKVIGATLTKLCTTRELYQNKFDNVIVDEASMAPQPHLWFAAALSTKRVVALGDFRQLQPICTAQSEIALKRIARSVYQEAGIVDEALRVRLGDPRLVSLRKQYRMDEKIGELVNDLVYREDGNPLEHHAPEYSTRPGRLANPEPEHPLILCDTTSVNPWCARLEPGYSRYNIYSAIVAIRLAQQVVDSTRNDKLEIGVMCPYTAQARLLNIIAKERELTSQVKVATVHRFQGNEKDVIIVDLVDGPPFDPGILLTKQEAKNLLNVAFSRAKGKVILVGHVGYFETRWMGEALDKTLAYFGKHARIIDSSAILSGYSDPEVVKRAQAIAGRTPIGNPEGMTLFNESTFYPAFSRDLISARERVIVFSPFVQPGRTSRIAPALRVLMENGVEVVVVTRPRTKRRRAKSQGDPGEHTAADKVVDDLISLGVKVLTRPRLHEKLAFIDDRITWMGSLNILSHSHTTEQMTRFENAELTKMFMEFNGIPTLFQKEEREAKKAVRFEQIIPRLGERISTPTCPQCGRRMVPRMGRYGIFFGCPSYPADKTTVPVSRAALAAIIDEMNIPCPDCGTGRMTLRASRRGVFLGCNRYPDCETTEPLW